MIITQTLIVGGKGYKSGQGSNGKPWQAMNFKAYPFEEYVSVFLPDYINQGDIVTVSGTVKKEVSGQYTNYSLQYPVIERMYQPEHQERQTDPLSGNSPMEVTDDDLPF